MNLCNNQPSSSRAIVVTEEDVQPTSWRRNAFEIKNGAVDERKRLAVQALAEYQSWSHLYELPLIMFTFKRQP